MKKYLIIFTALLIPINSWALTIIIKEDPSDTTIDSFARAYGYKDTINDDKGNPVQNPVSKIDFATAKIKSFIEDSATSYDVNSQVETVRTSAIASSKTKNVVNVGA